MNTTSNNTIIIDQDPSFQALRSTTQSVSGTGYLDSFDRDSSVTDTPAYQRVNAIYEELVLAWRHDKPIDRVYFVSLFIEINAILEAHRAALELTQVATPSLKPYISKEISTIKRQINRNLKSVQRALIRSAK